MTVATLLAEVLDDPDNIAARRVYADALIAAGDPRGELINVQCALEDAPPGERTALMKREAALLKEHAKAWMAPYGGAIFRPEFTRGFIEHAYVNTKKFVPVAPALLAAEPITSLSMKDLSNSSATTLGKVPGLARLRKLRVTESRLGTAGTEGLFAQPLPRLKQLNFYSAGIDDGGLAHLSTAAFPQLERLNLAGARATSNGLTKLFADPNLAMLRYLHLNWVVPGQQGAGLLADHLALPNLTHLDLSSNTLTNEHLRELRRNAVIRGLRALRLEHNNLDGAGALDALEPMKRLEVLDLSTNTIGMSGIAALVQLGLPLRVLRLYQTRLTDDELRVLAKATFPLTHLDLGYASITDLSAIGASSWPLEKLELWSCKIGDAGGAALANADFTKTLRHLSLGYTGIGDAGLRELTSASWPKLETIVFRGSSFTKAGMETLTKLPALRSVRFDTESPAKSMLRPLIDRGVRID